MADLLTSDAEDAFDRPRPGSLSCVVLPVGPDGETRSCLRAAVILADDGAARVALLLR